MVKLYFQHPYTPAASVTWSFRNHSNILIWCSRNISYYYQGWKQLCCLILVKNAVNFFRILWQIVFKKNSIYLKLKSFITL